VIFEPFEKSSSVYAGKYRAAFSKVKHLPNLKVVNFLKVSFCNLLSDAFLQQFRKI